MKKLERKGNLEVLKILCIILIIIHHYFVHGGCGDKSIIEANILIGFIGKNVGKIASNVFVLITGYFIFKSEFKIQKIIKIMCEFVFYSVLVNVIIAILLKNVNVLNYLAFSFFPIFFKLHWFVLAYIGMYLFIPFIKPALNKLSQKNYLILLLVLGFFISVIPTIIAVIFNVNLVESFGSVVTFLYLAMIGGYISKFNICIFKNKWYNLLTIIYLFLVFFIFGQLRAANSLFVLILSVLIIDLFLKLEIKNNKIISFFSNSSLGVLLLHDNALFNKVMWVEIFKTPSYYDAPVVLLLKHIVFCVVSIYLVGSLIDWVRRKIENKIFTKSMENDFLNEINKCFNSEV